MMRNQFNREIENVYMDMDAQQAIESDNSQSSSNSTLYSNHSPQYITLEVQHQPVYQIPQQPVHITPQLSQPRLIILEQPADKFRFRYSSEMHGTHGSLMGEHTSKNKKSYPQVKLEGFHGKAVIRCTLYQEKLTNPSPHSHSLVVRKNDMDTVDPHYFEVDGSANMTTIKCQGMGIIHTAKKEISKTLITKLQVLWQKEFNAEIGRKSKEFKDKAEAEAKSMNLNQVGCFLFAYNINNHWETDHVFNEMVNYQLLYIIL